MSAASGMASSAPGMPITAPNAAIDRMVTNGWTPTEASITRGTRM